MSPIVEAIAVGGALSLGITLVGYVAPAIASRIKHGPISRELPSGRAYARNCVDCGQRVSDGATCIQCRVRRQHALRDGKPVTPIGETNESDL